MRLPSRFRLLQRFTEGPSRANLHRCYFLNRIRHSARNSALLSSRRVQFLLKNKRNLHGHHPRRIICTYILYLTPPFFLLYHIYFNPFLTLHFSLNPQFTLNLDIVLPKAPCAILSLDVVDVTGVHDVNIEGRLHKHALDSNGKRKYVTDQIK